VAEIVEGWTGPIDLQLLSDGAVRVLSTGESVALILKARAGTLVVSTTDNLTVLSSTDGKVRYLPNEKDLQAKQSPYSARVKVTDGTGKIVFFPSGKSDEWIVYSQ
jgi:hypothetical protein